MNMLRPSAGSGAIGLPSFCFRPALSALSWIRVKRVAPRQTGHVRNSGMNTFSGSSSTDQ